MISADRMAAQAESLIKAWGSRTTVRRGEEERFLWGVIQPINSRSRRYQEASATYGGLADRGFAQIYFPGGEEPLREGDTVEQAGKRYLTLRGEKMIVQEKAVYCWAVLAGAPQEKE